METNVKIEINDTIRKIRDLKRQSLTEGKFIINNDETVRYLENIGYKVYQTTYQVSFGRSLKGPATISW